MVKHIPPVFSREKLLIMQSVVSMIHDMLSLIIFKTVIYSCCGHVFEQIHRQHIYVWKDISSFDIARDVVC